MSNRAAAMSSTPSSKDGPPPAEQSSKFTDTIVIDNLFPQGVTAEVFDSQEIRITSFGKLLDTLPLPVLLIDAAHSIVFVNEYCGIITQRYNDLISKPFETLFPYADHARTATATLKRVETKRKSHHCEVVLGDETNQMWGRIRFHSVKWGGGRAMLALVEDISVEKRQILLAKQHQEELHKAYSDLETRIQERTADLTAANKRLRQEVDLREQIEQKRKSLFENTPSPLWELDITQAVEALKALSQAGVTDYGALFGAQSDTLMGVLNLVSVVDCNEAAIRMHGVSCKAQALGAVDKWIVPEFLASLHDIFSQYMDGKKTLEGEVTTVNAQGQRIDLLVRMIVPKEDGVAKHTVVSGLDISDRKKAQRAEIIARMEWERTFNTVPDLIAIIDVHNKIVRVNKAMAARVNLAPDELVGKSCHEIFHESGRPFKSCPHLRMLREGKECVMEMEEERLGGVFLVSATPLLDDAGRIIGCVQVARDITARKKLEQALHYSATRDALTGLLNRNEFLHILSTEFRSAARYLTDLAVAICDIDKFKLVNDQHGHPAGDQALLAFSEVVEQELRDSDFAGRYGGDEFIIAFPHTSAKGAGECMERVRKAFEDRIFRNGRKQVFQVTCTIGLAEWSAGLKKEDVIQAADQALYRGKASGGNCVTVAKRKPAPS